MEENSSVTETEKNDDKDIVQLMQYIVEEPAEFFKKYVDRQKPVYFPVFIILFFLMYFMSASGTFFSQVFFGFGHMAGIGHYGFIFIIIGLVNGILAMVFLPLFYAIRINLSGGSAGMMKAFKLLIYSSAVPAVVSLSLTIVSRLVVLVPFDDDMKLIYSLILAVKDILFYAAMFLSVYISYHGVKAVTDVEESKSKIWFMILPFLWYGLTFVITVFRDIMMLGILNF